MRALYVPLALLAGLFILAMANSSYVTAQTEAWTSQLSAVETAAAGEDWPAALEAAQAAYQSWQARQFYFHSVIHHDELDEAEAYYLQLLTACRLQDPLETALHLAELRSQLRLLAEMEELSIPNVL